MSIQRHLLTDLRQALVNLSNVDWKTAGFNMGMWARNKLPETPELHCGTVCCAFGVGTTLPSWKHAQLYLVCGDLAMNRIIRYTLPHGDYSRNILGITAKQFDHIFTLTTYDARLDPVKITPSEVVDHIDDVLNGICS